MNPTRKVLVIAYYFPPSLEVGRMRTVKFCKFLPEFGWAPVVVTPKLPRQFDPALLAEIPPGTEVHRAGRGTWLINMLAAARGVRNALRRARRTAATTAGPTPSAGAPAPAGSSWIVKLYWPDLEAPWIGPAARQALALAPSCQVLYSSGWPMSCHVAALGVAQRTGLPWVMDLRDPWEPACTYPTAWQRRHYAKVERACVTAARWVVNVNENLTRQHREQFPDLAAEKFVTICNGIDPEDFAALPAPPAVPPLRVTFAGNLYRGKSGLPLVEAVRILHEEHGLTPSDLAITLMGSGNAPMAGPLKSLGLESFFRLLPRQPHQTALADLGSSHVALLIFDAQDTGATKLSEVTYLKKPALALVPRTPLREQLERAGAVCVDPDDSRALADALLNIYQGLRQGQAMPPLALEGAVMATRRFQAGELAGLLDLAAGGATGRWTPRLPVL